MVVVFCLSVCLAEGGGRWADERRDARTLIWGAAQVCVFNGQTGSMFVFRVTARCCYGNPCHGLAPWEPGCVAAGTNRSVPWTRGGWRLDIVKIRRSNQVTRFTATPLIAEMSRVQTSIAKNTHQECHFQAAEPQQQRPCHYKQVSITYPPPVS